MRWLILLLLTACAAQQLSPADCRAIGVPVADGAKMTGSIIAEHEGTLEEVMRHCQSPFEPRGGCALAVGEHEYVVWYSDSYTLVEEQCHARYEVGH